MMTPRDIADLSLLIIDDSRTMREMLRAALHALGVVTIHEAADGAAALDILASRRINGVFCDIEMPVLDGLGFVRIVRSGRLPRNLLPQGAQIQRDDDQIPCPPGNGTPGADDTIPLDAGVPIVMLTRRAERDSVEQAAALGANHYLIKPIRPPQLHRCLQQIVRAAHGESREGLDYTRMERPRFTHYLFKGQFSSGHDTVIRKIIEDILRRGPAHCVLDLSAVRGIDEFAIGSLLMINGLGSSRGKRIALIAGNPRLARDLRAVQLDRLLPVFDSLTRYTQSLARPARPQATALHEQIDLRQFA